MATSRTIRPAVSATNHYLNIKIWNADDRSVETKIISRWTQSDYDDLTIRAQRQATLKSEWDAKEYSRNRISEYPTTGEQMDMLYKDIKNSTTTHIDAIEIIKTKWPKDNSGPVE